MAIALEAVATELRRPVEKWGAAAIVGWQALPDVLLKHQVTLGLTATDMLVVINILSYWWYVDIMPFPRVRTIADRMGVTPRTVQRSLEHIISNGYFARKKDIGPDGKERDVLDPSGLAEILNKMAVRDPSYSYRKQKEKERGNKISSF